MSPVRRKNSIRRSGKGHLRDAWADSADDDGLPAAVGAGRRVAGVRHASTGGTATGWAMPVGNSAPETDLTAIGDADKRPLRCSGSDGVVVMETAEHRPAAHRVRRHGPHRRQPAGASRRLHAKPTMRASVVVAKILTQNAFRLQVVEDDEVVEAVSPE